MYDELSYAEKAAKYQVDIRDFWYRQVPLISVVVLINVCTLTGALLDVMPESLVSKVHFLPIVSSLTTLITAAFAIGIKPIAPHEA